MTDRLFSMLNLARMELLDASTCLAVARIQRFPTFFAQSRYYKALDRVWDLQCMCNVNTI